MITTPLAVFIGSTISFVLASFFVHLEQKRGRRLVLTGTRTWLDMFFVNVSMQFAAWWRHFIRYIVQLGWYYSIHSFLRATMTVLVSVYEYLETHFERNLHRTKNLRAEKRQRTNNHLATVAEHKAEVALTPEEGQKLKDKILEEKD